MPEQKTWIFVLLGTKSIFSNRYTLCSYTLGPYDDADDDHDLIRLGSNVSQPAAAPFHRVPGNVACTAAVL